MMTLLFVMFGVTGLSSSSFVNGTTHVVCTGCAGGGAGG